MTNVFEAISAIMKSLQMKRQNLAPCGRSNGSLDGITAFHEAHALYQIGLNTTTDKDMQHVSAERIGREIADTKKIEKLLLEERVPLPLVNPKKPNSDQSAVPEGVKLKDDEIANLISAKVAASITFCAQAMSKTVRTDVGLICFPLNKLNEICCTFKKFNDIKGMVRIPPAYNPPGSPNRE